MAKPKPGFISEVLEVSIAVIVRGKSTAQVSMLTADGSVHSFSVSLDQQQIDAVKSLARSWFEYPSSTV